MVPDFVRLGFASEIPLPNQGFPARFLESPPALPPRVLLSRQTDVKGGGS